MQRKTLDKSLQSPCKAKRFNVNPRGKRPSLNENLQDSYFSKLEKLKNPNSRSRDKAVLLRHGISADLGFEGKRASSQLNIYQPAEKDRDSQRSSGESIKNLYKRPISVKKERQNCLGGSLDDLERFNDYLERYSQNLRETLDQSKMASEVDADSCKQESLFARSPCKYRKSSLGVLKQRFSVLSRCSGRRTKRQRRRGRREQKSPKFIQINNFFGQQFEDFEALESQIYSKSGLEKENLINWADLSYDMSRQSVQGIYQKENGRNQLKSFRDIKIAGLRDSEKQISNFQKKGPESRNEISRDGSEKCVQKVYYKSQRPRKRGTGLAGNSKDKLNQGNKSRNGRRYRTGVEYAGEVSRSRSELGKDSRSFGNIKDKSKANLHLKETEFSIEPNRNKGKSKRKRRKRPFKRARSKKIEIRMGGKKLGILKINPSCPEEIDFIKERSNANAKNPPKNSKLKGKQIAKSKEFSNNDNWGNDPESVLYSEQDSTEMCTRLEFHKDWQGKMRSVLKRNSRISLASKKQKLVHLMKIGSSFCESRERGKMLRDYQNLRKRDASILSLNARNSKGSFENHCSFDMRGGSGLGEGKEDFRKGICLKQKEQRASQADMKRKSVREKKRQNAKAKMRDLVKDPARFVRETLRKRRFLSKKYTRRLAKRPSKNLKRIALVIDPSLAKNDSIVQRTPTKSRMNETEPKSCNLIHDRHYFRKTLRSPVGKDGKSLGSPVHSHMNPQRRRGKNLFGSDLSLLSEGQSAVMSGNPDLERSFAIAKSVMWSGASSANKRLRERSNSKSISALKREHEIGRISVKRSIQKKTLFGELVKRNGGDGEKGEDKKKRLAIRGQIVCSSVEDSVCLEVEDERRKETGDHKAEKEMKGEDQVDIEREVVAENRESTGQIGDMGKTDTQDNIVDRQRIESKDSIGGQNYTDDALLKDKTGARTTPPSNIDHKTQKQNKKVPSPNVHKGRRAKRRLKKINTNSKFCSVTNHFQKRKNSSKSKAQIKSKSKSVLHKRKITFGKNLSKRCWSRIPNSSLNSLKGKCARSLENVSRQTERSLARAKQTKIKRRLLGKSKRSSRDLEKTINSLSKMQHSVNAGDGAKSRGPGVFFYFGSRSGKKAAHTRTHGPMELKHLFESEGVMKRENLIKARMMAMSQRNLDKPSLISKHQVISGMHLGKFTSKRERRRSPFLGMLTPKAGGNFPKMGRCRTQNDEFSNKRSAAILENAGSEQIKDRINVPKDFANIEEFEMSRLQRDLLEQTNWKLSKEVGSSATDTIGLGKMTDFFRYLKNRNEDRQQAQIFRTETTIDKRNEAEREKQTEMIADSARGEVRHSNFKNMNGGSKMVGNNANLSKICPSWKLSKLKTEPSLRIKKEGLLSVSKVRGGPRVMLDRRSILSKSNLRSLLSQNTLGKEDGYFSVQHPQFLKKKNANYQSDYFYPGQQQNMNPNQNQNSRISVKMAGAQHHFFKTSKLKKKGSHVEQKPLLTLNDQIRAQQRLRNDPGEMCMIRPGASGKSTKNFSKHPLRKWGSQKSEKCQKTPREHPIRTRSSNPLKAKILADSQAESLLVDKLPSFRGFGRRHPVGLSKNQNRGVLRSRNQNKLKDKLLSQKIRAGLRRHRKSTPVKVGGSLRRMKERKLMKFEGVGGELDLKQVRRFCNSQKSNKLSEGGDQKSVLKELLEYIGKE